MFVLDTTVVSELMRAEPAPAVVDWLDAQPATDLWFTAIAAAELLYGATRLPPGRRRTDLTERIEAMLAEDFARRVLPFDEVAAAHYADIAANREAAGRPISMADAQIAAIVRSHGAILVTRNVTDFIDTGVTLVDPWRSGPVFS
ncbi:MAG: type II toxin-antitoxin system VapC family toxin [Vicinamibacterales bacterium]